MVNPVKYIGWRIVKPLRATRKEALRRKLAARLPRNGVGVEVGVFRGKHAKMLLEYAKPRELHLVDPWKAEGPEGSLWASTLDQGDMDRMAMDVKIWSHIHPKVHVHRVDSLNGSSIFEDEELDWLYLDGDHRIDAVAKDLEAWWPKVKPGGVIYGDDYSNAYWYKDQVQRAVQAFFVTRGVRVEVRGSYPHEQWWVEKGDIQNIPWTLFWGIPVAVLALVLWLEHVGVV